LLLQNAYGAQLRRNDQGKLELTDKAWCDICEHYSWLGPSSALPLQVMSLKELLHAHQPAGLQGRAACMCK
jgi:hypothetical protein